MARNKSEQAAVAVTSHVQWERGQVVYARWCNDDSKPKGDPARYWYEPWWIVKVGPKRLLVEDAFGDQRGYVRRDFLESTGWDLVYGPWKTPKGAIYAEWSEDYVRYRLYREERQAGKRLDPETIGGYLRTERRRESLEVLGLPLDADPVAIKAAYRQLAMTTHPDKGGDASRFIQIQNAYRALSQDWNPTLMELLREVERRVREQDKTA